MERERTATFYVSGQKLIHPNYSIIDLMDNDGPNKRPGLNIQNLYVSVLAASINRFPPHCERQDSALVTSKDVLQDWRGGRTVPQL